MLFVPSALLWVCVAVEVFSKIVPAHSRFRTHGARFRALICFHNLYPPRVPTWASKTDQYSDDFIPVYMPGSLLSQRVPVSHRGALLSRFYCVNHCTPVRH